jgi:hypothetical protein
LHSHANWIRARMPGCLFSVQVSTALLVFVASTNHRIHLASRVHYGLDGRLGLYSSACIMTARPFNKVLKSASSRKQLPVCKTNSYVCITSAIFARCCCLALGKSATSFVACRARNTQAHYLLSPPIFFLLSIFACTLCNAVLTSPLGKLSTS